MPKGTPGNDKELKNVLVTLMKNVIVDASTTFVDKNTVLQAEGGTPAGGKSLMVKEQATSVSSVIAIVFIMNLLADISSDSPSKPLKQATLFRGVYLLGFIATFLESDRVMMGTFCYISRILIDFSMPKHTFLVLDTY